MSSRTRAPQRRGGAALQMDVLDLSSSMDNSRITDGRFKAALEDMSNRAVRPDLEAASLRVDPTSESRLVDYLSFRKALVASNNEEQPPAAVDDSSVFEKTKPAASVMPPSMDVEIPFLLSASRCDAGAAGLPPLTRILACKAMKRLVYADLSYNSLTETGTSFTPFADMCNALASLPSLRFLSFAGNTLMAPGADSVARLLRTAQSLTHVDLSECSLGAAGAEELLPAFNRPLPADEGEEDDKPAVSEAEAALLADMEDPEIAAIIAAAEAERAAEQGAGKKKKAAGGARGPSAASVGSVNSTLLWLDLSGNNLCTYGFDPKPAAKLVRTLLAHPVLQHLNVARNRLGEGRGVAGSLSRGVARNTALVSLVLDDNSIDARPAAAIASGLQGNPSLTHLSLRGNRVRSDGASAFASLIRTSTVAGGVQPQTTALSWLDLRDNYIGTIGRSDLLLALQGLPPPPEVTRGRWDTEGLGAAGPEGEGSNEDGGDEAEGEEAVECGTERTFTELSINLERWTGVSRPATADGGGGATPRELESPASERPPSSLADPTGPALSAYGSHSRLPTDSDACEVGSVSEGGDEESVGGRSPSKRVAGSGVRAVMALRPDGSPIEDEEERQEEEAAPPPLPKAVVLDDGSIANQHGHRVML